MFGIGSFEIAIIALFGFLIFGPDKLPQIARTVGRGIRQFRSAQEQMNKVIKSEVYDPLKDLEPLANPFSGLSLDPSKDSKSTAGNSAKKTDTSSDSGQTASASKDAKSKAGSDTSSDTSAASQAEKPVLSASGAKAALDQKIASAKERASTSASKKPAGGSGQTESFAERRRRLEKEHAKLKEASSKREEDAKDA